MNKIAQCVSVTFISLMVTACQVNKENTEESTSPERNISAAKLNTQLGVTYLERGQAQRAKQKFLLALKLAPSIPEPWYGMGYFQETTGNIEEANTYYKKAIEIDPGRGDSLNNYGTYLCRHDHYQEAVSYFMKAANNSDYLDPPAAYENAGLCSLKYDKKEEALAFFEKALKQDDNRAVSLLASAELYHDFGEDDKARVNLKQYLDIGSPNARTATLSKAIS